jgi:hypothetical protein
MDINVFRFITVHINKLMYDCVNVRKTANGSTGGAPTSKSVQHDTFRKRRG